MAKTLDFDTEICTRCHATLETYSDVCTAGLAERCPGFEWIEREIPAAKYEATAEGGG